MGSPGCTRISATLFPFTKSPRWASLISDVSYRQFAYHGVNPRQPGEPELLANVIAESGLLFSLRFIRAKVQWRRLLCSVLAQFTHLVHAACTSLLLFPLIPSLCFVPLSLLPRVLFLALRKC